MDVFEAIAKRHSYRGRFDPGPVPREDLLRIVEAGIKAPSGYNGQSTSFVIVDDPSLIAGIADVTSNDVIRGAPAAIVCVMDPFATRDKKFAFGVEDYSAAVENMLLAVTAMGYASVWIDGVLKENDLSRKVGDLLGVPRDREVRVILPIGVPVDHWEQHEKKPLSERAWFNGFGEADRRTSP
jgi:nitroreductase